jgi:signal transduction histidine kinase
MRAKYVNGAAAALLRAGRQTMVGADVAAFLHEERVVAAARAATRGPVQGRTILEVEQDGDAGREVLRFIVRPARRDDAAVAMVIVEDITQQRVAENARNAFLAQATHELRTPLTNIRLYAEMGLEEKRDDPAGQANCLSVINQETVRLDRMVGDILSIAEIEAGTLRLKKDDVRTEELLRELQASYAPMAREKGVDLAFDLPPKLPVLAADRDKIALALHNLVGNALKYTPSGGSVRVTVADTEDPFTVEVADTGIGMTEEDCGHVFERFYRAGDRRVSDIEGSGLGLAIAREVARLHGGDITVQSQLEQGSTFTFTVPTAKEMALR